MNIIGIIFSGELFRSVAATIIHSFWQGAVIIVLLVIMIYLFGKRSARVRYIFSSMGLLSMIIISLLTFSRIYNSGEKIGEADKKQTTEIVKVTGPVGEAAERPLGTNLSDNLFIANISAGFVGFFDRYYSLIVTLWLAGMFFLSIRFLGGIIFVRRLRNKKNFNVPETWKKRFSNLINKANIHKPVQILESALIKIPMVIGHLKPVILIPIGTLSGIPQNQVEAIIAHELAHIIRKDYLVNILQSISEILYFYHPAVWWISSKMRIERENCCDDIAISLCGESLIYAKALANMGTLHKDIPFIAVAMTNKRKRLLNRIKRITMKTHIKTAFSEKLLAVIILIAGIFTLTLSTRASIYYEDDLELNISPVKNKTADTESTRILVNKADVRFNKESDFPFENVFLNDTIKKKIKEPVIIKKISDPVTGEEKELKILLDNSEVSELYIDGEKIPEEDFEKYEQLIKKAIEEEKAESEEEKNYDQMYQHQFSYLNDMLEEIDTSIFNREELFRTVEEALELNEEQMKIFSDEVFGKLIEKSWEMSEFQLQQQMESMEKMREEMKELQFNQLNQMQEHLEQLRISEINELSEEEINKRLSEIEERLWEDSEDREKVMMERSRNLTEILERSSLQLERQLIRQNEILENTRHRLKARDSLRLIKEIRDTLRSDRDFLIQSEVRDRMKEYQRSLNEADRLRTRELDAHRDRLKDILEESRIRIDEDLIRKRIEEDLIRERIDEDIRKRMVSEDLEITENVISAFKQELINDGLIKEGKKYEIEFSAGEFRINGKKQPEEVYAKYSELYEELTRRVITNETRFQIIDK